MLLKDLLNTIEKYLPAASALEGDKIGLQIQAGLTDVSKVLVTMELTDEVVEEAISIACDCIIAFHPLIFRPLAELHDDERVGRLTTKLIKHSIALISLHTTFDTYQYGTSRIIADKLELSFERFLIPDKVHNNTGMGIVGYFENALSPDELLERVSRALNANLRFCYGKPSTPIKRVAIVGGSGSSFLNEAYRADVDAYITADCTYHTFHVTNGNLMLIDPGHYEMEQFVGEGIANLLKSTDETNTLEIFVSKVRTNPIESFCLEDSKKIQIEYLNNVKING